MRQGRTPQAACEEAVMRIVKKQQYKDFQIGYIAINKAGEHGAYCIHKGFDYSIYQAAQAQTLLSKSYLQKEMK